MHSRNDGKGCYWQHNLLLGWAASSCGWCCYPRHILKLQSARVGCYPAHISYPDLLAAPLLISPSALHGPVGKVRTFSSGPADAPARAGLLLSTAQILAQFSAQGCYSQHNLTQPWARAARQCGLLSAAQFNRRPTAVTVRSITAGLFALYCYSAHISLPFAPAQPTSYRVFMKTDF